MCIPKGHLRGLCPKGGGGLYRQAGGYNPSVTCGATSLYTREAQSSTTFSGPPPFKRRLCPTGEKASLCISSADGQLPSLQGSLFMSDIRRDAQAAGRSPKSGALRGSKGGIRNTPWSTFAYFPSTGKVWPGFRAAAPMATQIFSIQMSFAREQKEYSDTALRHRLAWRTTDGRPYTDPT